MHRRRAKWGNCLLRMLQDLHIQEMERRIKKTEGELKRFMMYKQMGKGEWDSSRGLDVERAKEFPIGDLIQSEPTGRSSNRVFYKCPLHNEKTGSFVWYKNNNSYYCFGGCGIGGDVIDLYMKMNEVDFKTAVQALT